MGDKAEQEEIQRRERINYGTKLIRDQFDQAFNNDFYKTMEANARKLYEPQVKQQYADSLSQLQAALARSGLSTSTQANKKSLQLADQLYNAKQTMRANIINSINARKGDVANAENTAITQLENSADPFAATAQAARSIERESQQPAFSPLGQLFTDATAGLATQADMERQGTNRYDMGVSNWWKPGRSVSTVRG